MTGTADGMRQTARAVDEYVSDGGQSVVGIHFEGPFINPARAGVHDPTFMRPLGVDDIGTLPRVDADRRTVLTIAPEVAAPGAVKAAVAAGFLVSVGHSDATAIETSAAFASGAVSATHLFNAMRGLEGREAGVVGACLAAEDVWAGIIADGHHVDFAAVRVAWKAKGPRLTLVSDAMPPLGSRPQIESFIVGGRLARVADGQCTLEDGTLAGPLVGLAEAVRHCVQKAGIPFPEALRMASLYPAQMLGIAHRVGRIAPGYEAHLTVFDDQLEVVATIVGGRIHPRPVSGGRSSDASC